MEEPYFQVSDHRPKAGFVRYPTFDRTVQALAIQLWLEGSWKRYVIVYERLLLARRLRGDGREYPGEEDPGRGRRTEILCVEWH